MSKYIIAFDLGGTSLKYGFGNKNDGLMYFNIKFHEEKSLNGLIALFRSVIIDLRKRHHTFTSLCIASPGIIDCDNGTILGSVPNLPFLKGLNLKEILEEISGLPVFIENDANLMTYAEAYNYKTDTVLGITIGTGIGTGFVNNNVIFNGENWMAMEAGHMIVVPDGRQCLCGKRGCLEAYCSAESMRKIVNELVPETIGLNIGKILSFNNELVREKIYQTLNIFAVGLSNLIMILNPGTLVIGGGVIEIECYDFDYLKKQIYQNLLIENRGFEIKKALYGNKAGVIGAMLYGER